MAIVLSLASLVTFASADVDTQLALQTLESGKKALVKAWNLPANRSALIRILNEEGETIYREQFNTSAYAKKYDLSQLQAGSYKLVLSSGALSLSEKFIVDAKGAVSVLEEPKVENFRPIIIRHNDKKVDVMMQNPFDKEVNISIVDRRGNVLYQDSVAPDAQVARRLNLSKLSRDRYTLLISSGQFSYAEEVSLF
ncbi:MAG: hypothetical protein ACLFUB_08040 [Cyclobacteriaceae bacterium]